MTLRRNPVTFALLYVLIEQARARPLQETSHPLQDRSDLHDEWVTQHSKGLAHKVSDPHFGELTLPNMQGLSVYGTKVIDPNRTLELSCGKIEAREYGAGNSKFAMAVHSVYSTGTEWSPVAEKLAVRDFHVLIPDWSGNKNTRPANCYEEKHELPRWQKQPHVYSDLFDEILVQVGRKKFDALLGFSWGGWIATMRAAKFPGSVGKVALVAPAFLEEEEALSPSFAGYISTGTTGKDLSKMSNPRKYLDKLCANAYGRTGRAALDTEVINGSFKITIHEGVNKQNKTWLHGLAKAPNVKPPAWGDGHGAIVACKKAEDCTADGKWTKAVTSTDNHHWPTKSEEFKACDTQCDQVVCAAEKPTVHVPAALFWGKDDTAVHFENSKWVSKMFSNLETFYHEPGTHLIHPHYESKIVSFLAPGVEPSKVVQVLQNSENSERPIGSVRRLAR